MNFASPDEPFFGATFADRAGCCVSPSADSNVRNRLLAAPVLA